MIYLENTVFDEALRRIRLLFDTHDDLIVAMSGGKDSCVLFNLTMMVAKELGRLPLKVFWLDQEAEWQATVDYMNSIMRRPDVKPYWFQIPFDFTNSLSAEKNFVRVWDENAKDYWVHPQVDISIKENPTKYNRFHDLVDHLPSHCTESDDCAFLVGMRMNESLVRRTAITYGEGRKTFHGETWCKRKMGRTQVFWPIYDFTNDDIWTAIAKNKWPYNRIYDYQYQYGYAKADMRVSALIHETAWHNIRPLQEFEPQTYDRFVRRIHGVSTFNHAFDTEVIPTKLPFAFASWTEYRDYLLENITKPEYRPLFKKRWANQKGEDFAKLHVSEIIINDIDGTINANHVASLDMKRKAKAGKYKAQDKALFEEYKRGKDNDKRPTD